MEVLSPRISTPHNLRTTALPTALPQYAECKLGRTEFLQAAQISREHYNRTGLHITLDEFGTWVDAVQANPQAQMPQCHL